VVATADPNATFTFLADGFSQELWAVGSTWPIGQAFAANGDVLTCYGGGHRYSATATSVVHGSTIHAESALNNSGCNGFGLTNHPNGKVYENGFDGVRQLDPNKDLALLAGPYGASGSQYGIATDPQTGNLVYVASDFSIHWVNPGFTAGGVFSNGSLGHGLIDQIAFDPTGNFLFLSGWGDHTLIVLAHDGSVVQVVHAGHQPDGIAFHTQGAQFVATNNTDGTLTQWNFPFNQYSGTPTELLLGSGAGYGDHTAIGPDGCWYVSNNNTRYADGTTAGFGLVRICPGFQPPPGVSTERYVALGDSYSSGEGTYNYDPTTETSADFCHRSVDAYPVLLASEQAGVKVPPTLSFAACSGAPISAFYSSFSNEAPQLDAICKPVAYVAPMPGEASAGHTPCTDNSVSLVTVTVGGDDLGFKDVLSACVTNRSDQERCLGQDPYVTFGGQVPEQDTGCNFPCFSDGTDPSYFGIERIEERLRQLYTDIRGRAPHARIVVLGYPHIFPATGADDGSCHLSTSDELWLNQKAAEVDAVVGFAVNASGVAEYADAYQAVNGHEACAGSFALTIPWINGLVLTPAHPTCFSHIITGGDAECFESFHPTPDGYKALAQVAAVQIGKSAPGSCGVGCAWLVQQAGASTSFTVNVPANTAAASFSTSWKGRDVAMSLTTPSGQVINRQTNFVHFNHANGDGYEYYSVPNFDPTQLTLGSSSVRIESGIWTVTLSAASATQVIFKLAVAAPRDPTPLAVFTARVHTFSTGGPFAQTEGVVVFDAKPSFDPDGDIDTYIWDFRDGTTGSGAHVEHTYHGSGKYCPLLTVIDESGQSGHAGAKVLVDSTDPGDCV
jgi:hypothetical protein